MIIYTDNHETMRKNICKYWIENSFLSREYQQEIKEKIQWG